MRQFLAEECLDHGLGENILDMLLCDEEVELLNAPEPGVVTAECLEVQSVESIHYLTIDLDESGVHHPRPLVLLFHLYQYRLILTHLFV